MRSGRVTIAVIKPNWLCWIGLGFKQDARDGIVCSKIAQFDRRIVAIISLEKQRVALRTRVQLNNEIAFCVGGRLIPTGAAEFAWKFVAALISDFFLLVVNCSL